MTTWRKRAILVTTACAAAFPTDVSSAQVIVNGAVVNEEQKKPSGGFSLPREDDSFAAALEDFDRYRDKKQWELAFRAITKLADGPGLGFVDTPDGLLVPSRQRIRTALLTLPTEGLEAYRLFFDAKAKRMLADALASIEGSSSTGPVSSDTATLQKIVDQYFLTASGALAADRLGDAYFEAGHFSAAAEQWRMIVEHYPDPPMPAVRLAAKRGVAMARLARWPDLDALARDTSTKFPGDTVTVGGQSVDIAAYFQSLRDTAAPATRPAGVTEYATAVPASNAEAWQSVFLDSETAKSWRDQLASMGWNRFMTSPDQIVPPAVADDKRVYVNWMGNTFAIDLATGKLAWRTSKFSDITKQGSNFVQSGVDGRKYALALDGKHLFALGAVPNPNGVTQASLLRCLEADTGKTRWTTAGGPFAAYSFCGAPVVADGTLYAVAGKQDQGKLELMAIEPDTGRQKWSIELGTATVSQNFRGQQVIPVPVVEVVSGFVYVLTNNGALLCVDPEAKAVRWALRTEGPVLTNREDMFISSNSTLDAKIEPPGAIVAHDGILYLKEQATRKLYALDPSVPRLVWKRPLEKEQSLAGVRDGRLILIGAEAGAIDPASHALQWSTTLRVETGDLRPVFAGNSMFVNTSRGIYQISVRQGDVQKIFRGVDVDTVGGALLITRDKLIAVSNRTVTAYPLTQPEPAQ